MLGKVRPLRSPQALAWHKNESVASLALWQLLSLSNLCLSLPSAEKSFWGDPPNADQRSFSFTGTLRVRAAPPRQPAIRAGIPSRWVPPAPAPLLLCHSSIFPLVRCLNVPRIMTTFSRGVTVIHVLFLKSLHVKFYHVLLIAPSLVDYSCCEGAELGFREPPGCVALR